jgi:hypothetical protein
LACPRRSWRRRQGRRRWHGQHRTCMGLNCYGTATAGSRAMRWSGRSPASKVSARSSPRVSGHFRRGHSAHGAPELRSLRQCYESGLRQSEPRRSRYRALRDRRDGAVSNVSAGGDLPDAQVSRVSRARSTGSRFLRRDGAS